MNFKPGGGDKLQPYSKYNGRYIESDLSDLVSDIVQVKLFGVKKQNTLEWPFPINTKFSKEYCEVYVTYVFDGSFEVPINKMTNYLFIHQEISDKSGWLKLHGYTLSNYKEFEKDLISHSRKHDLEFEDINEYNELIFTQIIRIPEKNNLIGKVVWKLGPHDKNLKLVTFKKAKEMKRWKL